MNCERFDPLAALDGLDPEAVEHSRSCLACRREMIELQKVLSVAEQAFRERLMEEAEEEGEGEDELEPMPAAFKIKIGALRRSAHIGDLRKRFGMSLEAARSLVDRMLRGEAIPEPMAAGPKKMVEPEDEDLETAGEPEPGDREDDDRAGRKDGEDDGAG